MTGVPILCEICDLVVYLVRDVVFTSKTEVCMYNDLLIEGFNAYSSYYNYSTTTLRIDYCGLHIADAVDVIKKFCFRSIIILWCESISNYGVKSLLHLCLEHCFYSLKCSKNLNTYSGCNLCPTLLYLGYVLGPGSLSCWFLFGVHSFYRTGDSVAVWLVDAKTPPTKPKVLDLACLRRYSLICSIGRP